MSEFISIIIPCYNAENYIAETINSVLKQTYCNYEIIIIDDGSSDRSKERIKSINSSKIRYVYQENSGVSQARNNGFLIAKGKYVLFLDADDLISENFIEKRALFLEANSSYGACTSSILTINRTGELIGESFFNISIKQELLNFENNKYSCPSGYLFKVSNLIKSNLIFDKRLSSSADQYFLYEFFKENKIGYIQESPLMYRVLNDSMSNNLTLNFVEDQIQFLRLLRLNSLIPKKSYNKVSSRMNYTIGASYFHLNMHFRAIQFLLKSFIKSPGTLLKLVFLK